MAYNNFFPNYANVPASASDQSPKPAPGVVGKVVVLTSGTGTTQIQDANTGHAGTVLLNIPATPTVGTIYDLDVSVALGITVVGAANTSALLITFA